MRPTDGCGRLNIPNSSSILPQSSCSVIPPVKMQGSVPPPLPPRLHNNGPSGYGSGYYPVQSYSMFGGLGGNYYGLGGGGYGGYGGGYGMSSYGYGGSYNMPFRGGLNGRPINDIESSFIQMAEESSRPAFQSVESIVRTFASVTMMLESTLHAMHTSFHAVLGVADNFGRLRELSTQITKYLSALAVVRTLYWFVRRVFYMLGLIKNHPSKEDVWSTVEQSLTVQEVSKNLHTNQSSWPIVTFFGILFGGPFLIYKLISSVKGSSDKAKETNWDPRIHESEEVVVTYRFRAGNEKELSIEPGEKLMVPSPKFIKDNNSGWIPAVNQNNRFGLVPLNYLTRVRKPSTISTVSEAPVPEEIVAGNEKFLGKNLIIDEKPNSENNPQKAEKTSPVSLHTIKKPSSSEGTPQ